MRKLTIALIAAALAGCGQPAAKDETMIGKHVYRVHDDEMGATCYVATSRLSCLADADLRQDAPRYDTGRTPPVRGELR